MQQHTLPRAIDKYIVVRDVGNGKYVALGRVLPFLQGEDILNLHAEIKSELDWTITVRPTGLRALKGSAVRLSQDDRRKRKK